MLISSNGMANSIVKCAVNLRVGFYRGMCVKKLLKLISLYIFLEHLYRNYSTRQTALRVKIR